MPPTYYLDNDTVYENGTNLHTNVTDLPCAGVTRSLLCCKPACP